MTMMNPSRGRRGESPCTIFAPGRERGHYAPGVTHSPRCKLPLVFASIAAPGFGAACPADAQTAAPVSDAVAKAIVNPAARPRLVVVLSIDQFRADYLTRLADLYLPPEGGGEGGPIGGFRYLMERGAYYANARYEHYPLFTGPGHAVILTGGHPYKTGIVSNDWWDTHNREPVYCTDPAPGEKVTVVGAAPGSKARPMSAANLHSTTVGDELKMATAGRAKVITLAVKDRAAILLGGHAQDVSIWYDAAGGRWISSSAFCRSGELPAWVTAVNEQHIPDAMLGKEWTPTVPAEVLAARTFPPVYAGKDIPAGFGAAFPHKVGAGQDRASYRTFAYTPAANDFVFKTAAAAVHAEGLGAHDVPDLLAMNLSTNDYVGHAFGPYSAEALDLTVRTDRQLSAFLNDLDKSVPGGLKSVLFVLTADHGVSPIPESVSGEPFDLPAGQFKSADVTARIAAALTARFGGPTGETWFATSAKDPKVTGAFLDGFVYLNPAAVRAAIESGKARSRRDIEQAACDAVNGAGIRGVYGCFGKTQILEGALADNDLKGHLAKAVHPQISSDLIVLAEQLRIEDPRSEDHATTHGTPYAYDTHVPVLVCQPGVIRPGVYAEAVAPSDIAPTLSLLLGIEFPSACDGKPLLSALKP